MLISLIAAVDERGGIGRGGRLPWHLSDDLKNFRALTLGHHVLMGRKTYRSAQGKMPGRKLMVLSRDPEFRADDAITYPTLEAAVAAATAAGEEELFVIGGAQVFAQALPLATRFYLTRVYTDAGCDVFFPEFDISEWKLTEQRDFVAGEKNDFAFSILRLDRR
jgi:dihydrofolate reductase